MTTTDELLSECRRRQWTGEVGWNCIHRTDQFSAIVCAPGCTGSFYRGRGNTPYDALRMAMDNAEAKVHYDPAKPSKEENQ